MIKKNGDKNYFFEGKIVWIIKIIWNKDKNLLIKEDNSKSFDFKKKSKTIKLKLFFIRWFDSS